MYSLYNFFWLHSSQLDIYTAVECSSQVRVVYAIINCIVHIHNSLKKKRIKNKLCKLPTLTNSAVFEMCVCVAETCKLVKDIHHKISLMS